MVTYETVDDEIENMRFTYETVDDEIENMRFTYETVDLGEKRTPTHVFRLQCDFLGRKIALHYYMNNVIFHEIVGEVDYRGCIPPNCKPPELIRIELMNALALFVRKATPA
jgi:hypothetical protein